MQNSQVKRLKQALFAARALIEGVPRKRSAGYGLDAVLKVFTDRITDLSKTLPGGNSPGACKVVDAHYSLSKGWLRTDKGVVFSVHTSKPVWGKKKAFYIALVETIGGAFSYVDVVTLKDAQRPRITGMMWRSGPGSTLDREQRRKHIETVLSDALDLNLFVEEGHLGGYALMIPQKDIEHFDSVITQKIKGGGQ